MCVCVSIAGLEAGSSCHTSDPESSNMEYQVFQACVFQFSVLGTVINTIDN